MTLAGHRLKHKRCLDFERKLGRKAGLDKSSVLPLFCNGGVEDKQKITYPRYLELVFQALNRYANVCHRTPDAVNKMPLPDNFKPPSELQ